MVETSAEMNSERGFFKKNPLGAFKSSRLDYAEDHLQRVSRLAFTRLGLLERYAPQLFAAEKKQKTENKETPAADGVPVAVTDLQPKFSSHRIKSFQQIKDELAAKNKTPEGGGPVRLDDDGGLSFLHSKIPRYQGLDPDMKPPPPPYRQAPGPGGQNGQNGASSGEKPKPIASKEE